MKLDPLALLAPRGCLAGQGHLGAQEHKGRAGQRVWWVRLVPLAIQASKGFLVRWVLRVEMERREVQDLLGVPALQVPPARSERAGPQALQAAQGIRETQEVRVQRETRVDWGRVDPQAITAPLARQALQAPPVAQVDWEHQVVRVPQVHLVPAGRLA